MWTAALLCFAFASPALGRAAADADTDWPSFRGAFARGIAEGHATPSKWNVADGTNVLWRTPIPGLAHSSPVIVGEHLFVTTAVGEGEAILSEVGKGRTEAYGDIWSVPAEGPQKFEVVCLDKQTGAILWTRTAFEGEPRFKRHPKSSYAASTPAADGERVVAFFGSEGLYGYDHAGQQLWKKDLGELNGAFYMAPTAEWGMGSSPVIFEGRVYLQVDAIGQAFLACFDAKTGEELWRTLRDDIPSWGTPTIHVGLDRTQVIANGYKHIGGYDLETGAELWKLVGGGDIPTPTPIVGNDLIFITNAHGRLAPIYAVHVDAEGTVSAEPGAEGSEHMAWSNPRRGNYMQTPLVFGDELYLCNDAGILSCFASLSGEELYRERLSSGNTGYTASPVAADGKLYCTSEDGEVQVVKLGKEFEVLEINDLGEVCMATPAISAGVLYWRTRGQVIAIGAK